MKRSLGISILCGVILLLALATGFSLLYRILYILLLLITATYLWGRLSLRWLEVQVERRTLQAQVGEPIVERITVRNTGRLPISWLEVLDLTDIPKHHTGLSLNLSSKAFRSWKTSTTSHYRGIYSLGPLRITTGDPLGIFRFERRYAGRDQVVVYPAVVPLPYFQLAASGLPGEGPPRQRTHEVTPHASTVREYRPGDHVGRIHWPSSAKLGHLMVKEFDQGLTSDLWVLLDLNRESLATLGDESAEETAVTIAASISARFLKEHLPVGVAISGNMLATLQPENGDLQATRIMDLLARVTGKRNTPLSETLGTLEPWMTRRTSLVIVTTSTDKAWISALEKIVLRGIQANVVLVDSSSYGGTISPEPLLSSIVDLGIVSYLVKQGDDINHVLSTPRVLHRTNPVLLTGRYGR